ncbi:MAG: hypothetical protein ACREU2_14745 [Steroidobacteraceae bacterium]
MRLQSISLAALLLATAYGAAAVAADSTALALEGGDAPARALQMAHMGHMAVPTGLPAGVTVVPVAPNLDMVAVHGRNVAVQFGRDGVLVVDSGTAADSATLLDVIKRISPQPIRIVVDTSASPDRAGGNAALSVAGHGFTQDETGFGGGRFVGDSPATIIAQANVLTALTATPGVDLAHALPTLTFNEGAKDITLNGDSILMKRVQPAHSDGDVFVVFRRADVIVAGDILDMQHFPQIDLAHGGSINGEVDALNRLLDMTVPALPLYWNGGGTVVIPAAGRLAQAEEVVQYRDMITIVRDRIKALIDQHRSLAQVRAADPTAGYSARYGAQSGPYATDRFVTAVYQSLMAARGHGRGR